MKTLAYASIVLLSASSLLGCRATTQKFSPLPQVSSVNSSATNSPAEVDQNRSFAAVPADSGPATKVIQASFNQQDSKTAELNDGLPFESEVVAADGGMLLGLPDAVTPPSGQMLTLEDAEQFAVANNPDLRKAQASIESLQGKHLQVGLKPNPQVGYLSADVGEEGTAGQQGGFFSQTFIRGGKLAKNRAIVCQEIEAAKQQLEIDRQRLLTDVRQRFYDLLVAQHRVATIQKFSSLSQQAADISDTLYREEEISKIANLRSQLQVKSITVIREQANNGLAGATRRFAATIGMGGPDSIEAGAIVASGAAFPNVSFSDPRSSFALISDNSPEIALAFSQLEAAKWRLNRQLAEPTRDVQVQAGFTHGNVTGEDLVAMQVGVPLRINDRNQGNISSARSEIAKAVQHIESIKRDLSKRFSSAWQDYENARIQTDRYQNEIIPAAAEFYQLVNNAYKEGEIEYLDLISAQQAYLDASLKSLDAQQSFWRAAALIDGYLLSAE